MARAIPPDLLPFAPQGGDFTKADGYAMILAAEAIDERGGCVNAGFRVSPHSPINSTNSRGDRTFTR